MTSGEKDRDGPAPADDDERNLLFGWQEDSEPPEPDRQRAPERPERTAGPERPGASSAAKGVTESEAPPDLTGLLASLEANQQRILARLADLTATPPAHGEGGFGEVARTIAEASEWTNNIKAAMGTHLEAAGQLIEGLKGGRRDLDTVVEALKSRQDELGNDLGLLAEGRQALGALVKRLDERTSALEAVKQELATYYGQWTEAAVTYGRAMNTLSKRLDAGDNMVTRLEGLIEPWTARMEAGVAENAEAQREYHVTAVSSIQKLTGASDTFLERFDTVGEEALAGFRREWTRTRRWTMPALALALVLAMPSFAVLGAYGQRDLEVFTPHDDTRGWKQGVWDLHGSQVKECMLESKRTKGVFKCSFDVTYSREGRRDAERLPPLD